MVDPDDTLEQAKAWAIQAQRQLDAAEALLRERKQKLKEALALVAAREPVALLGVPEPSTEIAASMVEHQEPDA